jgi:hypothetical protein
MGCARHIDEHRPRAQVLQKAATRSEPVRKRSLKRHLKRTPETIRPEVETGFSIADACLNQPRTEAGMHRGNDRGPARLLPAQFQLSRLDQMPADVNVPSAIGQSTVLCGVGGELMETHRERERRLRRHPHDGTGIHETIPPCCLKLDWIEDSDETIPLRGVARLKVVPEE